jgi:hypothetical protein
MKYRRSTITSDAEPPPAAGDLGRPSQTGGVTIDELCINTIRTLAMDAVQEAHSGHPGAPMALAPVVYC